MFYVKIYAIMGKLGEGAHLPDLRELNYLPDVT